MVTVGSSFVRAIAIALLLVSAMNFVQFDLEARTLLPSPVSQSDDSCGDPAGGHDCFACCGHVVPVVPADLFVHLEQISIVEHPEPQAPTLEAAKLFHPPKF